LPTSGYNTGTVLYCTVTQRIRIGAHPIDSCSSEASSVEVDLELHDPSLESEVPTQKTRVHLNLLYSAAWYRYVQYCTSDWILSLSSDGNGVYFELLYCTIPQIDAEPRKTAGPRTEYGVRTLPILYCTLLYCGVGRCDQDQRSDCIQQAHAHTQSEAVTKAKCSVLSKCPVQPELESMLDRVLCVLNGKECTRGSFTSLVRTTTYCMYAHYCITVIQHWSLARPLQ
jgi:hypothetical protein